jgi:hypothetical protein
MQPNYQAILSDCIERGIMAAMHSLGNVDPAMLQTLEHCIWIEIDSYFTFDEAE